jgi:hypothetical protein
VPFARQLAPASTFDAREVFAIHARGIAAAAEEQAGADARERAFTMSAELFLMQHSCHWFCKSRAVASARMLARHKTSYEQALAAVAPATQRAYVRLVGG